MKFGDFDLNIISDGTFRLDGGAMFGVVPKVLWEKTNPANKFNRILMELNCLLIRRGEDAILVDTGIGTLFDEKFARIYEVSKPPGLPEGLAALGLEPEAITKVVLTHLHFDHCGGNCRQDESGEIIPTFPNATYYINRGELADAKNPEPRSRASYLPHNWEPLERRGQVELVDDDREIAPGVTVTITPGHTDHHQIIKVRAGGKTACYLGDLVPTSSHLKIPYVMSYDLAPGITQKTKEAVLKPALEENWLLFFEHCPRVAAGYLRETDGELAVEPVAM